MKIRTTTTITRAELDTIKMVEAALADQFGELVQQNWTKEEVDLTVRVKSKLQYLQYTTRLRDDLELEYTLEIDPSVMEHIADIVATIAEAAGPMLRAGKKTSRLMELLSEDEETSVDRHW